MPAKQYHIEITSPNRTAPELLALESGLSISEAKQAMQKGAVWLSDNSGTRRLRRAGKKLPMDSTLHFYHNPEILALQVEPPSLHSDEGDYSVWIKPRGVLSQGSKWGDHCSITRMIETTDRKQRPAFLVHRLDKASTGLILIGHSKRATKLLAEMFAKRTIRKTYQAIVKGCFGANKQITLDSDIDGKRAISHVHSIASNNGNHQTLVEVTIDTGRKHQIRKHLSEAGHPIIGDRLYGGGESHDLQLAAVSLAFRCPSSDIERDYRLPDQFRPCF